MKNVQPKTEISIKSVIIFIIVLSIFYIIGLSGTNNVPKGNNVIVEETEITCFSEISPIHIGANIDKKFMNVYFHNESNKNITAIQILFICYDVYGKKFTPIYKYQYDKYIVKPNKTNSVSLSIPKGTKYVDIYLYDVYYKNGEIPEWGSRELKTSEVLEYAPKFHFEYEY